MHSAACIVDDRSPSYRLGDSVTAARVAPKHTGRVPRSPHNPATSHLIQNSSVHLSTTCSCAAVAIFHGGKVQETNLSIFKCFNVLFYVFPRGHPQIINLRSRFAVKRCTQDDRRSRVRHRLRSTVFFHSLRAPRLFALIRFNTQITTSLGDKGQHIY